MTREMIMKARKESKNNERKILIASGIMSAVFTLTMFKMIFM